MQQRVKPVGQLADYNTVFKQQITTQPEQDKARRNLYDALNVGPVSQFGTSRDQFDSHR